MTGFYERLVRMVNTNHNNIQSYRLRSFQPAPGEKEKMMVTFAAVPVFISSI
jgi:hypothetical protein